MIKVISVNNQIKVPSKHITMTHNVTFVVRDASTEKVVSVHKGHNAATNSLLTGIAHYLTGDGILNQGWDLLSSYVPKYISLGTMGLVNQNSDASGYPAGIGVHTIGVTESYEDYMNQCPGYGSDGYDINLIRGRKWFGLGPKFSDRDSESTVNCELISESFPRCPISFRDIVPETESEFPQTIDVVFSAMISTGALAQFREPDKDYIFITEAGLWSRQDWVEGGDNGLLAAYRIVPPNSENWDMNIPSNREILKQSILRVNKNQVVQVIWKIQLGGLDQLIQTI